MSAYLGYVKQDVDSQVNWGEVGKTFTDMLSAESKRREDLKTEIDDNTRTDLEKLANIPKGSSEEYNKWTTDAADKISQARLLQVKELKAGRLSLKDYNNYRQNTVSGVNNMVATVKSYNAWYEEGMKRAESKEAGAAELWKNSLLESMKFRDTIPNIALDGTMSVTKKVMNPKTGLMEVSTNPADAFTFSSMLDFGKKKFNRFKAKETLDDLSKVVGQYTKALNQGNVGTRTSVFQKDAKGNFINPQVGAIKNQVKSSIANPNDAMSVLVDFKGTTPSGEPYEFTLDAYDPRLKGAGRDNIILLDKATMNPQLTANQLKRAEDIMIEGLMSRSDVIETPYEKPRVQQWEVERAYEENKKLTTVSLWDSIANAPDAKAQQLAVDQFINTDAARTANLKGIDFKTTPGSMILSFNNGERDREIKTGQMSRLDWARLGAEITDVSDEKTISKALGRNYKNQINTFDSGVGASSVKSSRKGTPPSQSVKPTDYIKEFNARIDKSINTSYFLNKKSEATSEYINKTFGDIGVVAEPSSRYFNNDIKVSIGDKSVIINSSGNNSKAALNLNKLRSFIKNTVPATEKSRVSTDTAP
jgi:hypothetical protein